jgi:hypothetical protein
MEGKWDYTFGINKSKELHKHHPGSRLVVFEHSSHNPFEDEPTRFFRNLKGFAGKCDRGEVSSPLCKPSSHCITGAGEPRPYSNYK